MKSIKYMTLKVIAEQLQISTEKAKQVKNLIAGKIPSDSFPSVQAWINQCYNRPSVPELRMEALNEITECYGTEAVFSPDYSITSPLFVYCNAADTYNATIIRLYDCGKYVISCWGDVLEYYESKGYTFNY